MNSSPLIEQGSGGFLLFPVPMNDAVLQIGQGFNMIEGRELASVALPAPAANQLLKTRSQTSQSHYFYVKDSSSFSDAFKFSLSAGGGGWGASYGLTADTSVLVETKTLTQTIQLRAVAKEWQIMILQDTPLLTHAAALLAKGLDEFTRSYSTHFVAGYVYGKSCNLSYHLNFASLYLATQFSASYNESVSGLGFSDQLQTSISNALKKSQSSCEFSVTSYIQGLDAPVPYDMKSLENVVDLYGKAPGSDPENGTPIFYIVAPWSYLAAVRSAASIGLGGTVQQLATLTNRLTYIANSCDRFRESNTPVGKTQLAAVRQVGKRAHDELNAIIHLLSACNQSGVPPTQEQVDSFTPPEELESQMTGVFSRFLLAFSVATGEPDRLQLGDLGPSRDQISLSDRLIKSEKGVWFDWSISNNDGWEGTRNTSSKRHDLAAIFDGSYFVGDVAVVLDGANGTVQAWFCQADGELSRNLRSDPLKIRGTSNAGPLDNSNPSCLAWDAPGTSIRVRICPM